jgi:hypothetical protein
VFSRDPFGIRGDNGPSPVQGFPDAFVELGLSLFQGFGDMPEVRDIDVDYRHITPG